MSRRHSRVVVLCICGGIRRFCRLNLSAVFNICYRGHRKSSLFFNIVNSPRQLLHLAFQHGNAPCEVVVFSHFAGQFLNLSVGHGLRRVQLCHHLLIGCAVRQHHANDRCNTRYASNDNFYHLAVASAFTDFAISHALSISAEIFSRLSSSRL